MERGKEEWRGSKEVVECGEGWKVSAGGRRVRGRWRGGRAWLYKTPAVICYRP